MGGSTKDVFRTLIFCIKPWVPVEAGSLSRTTARPLQFFIDLLLKHKDNCTREMDDAACFYFAFVTKIKGKNF